MKLPFIPDLLRYPIGPFSPSGNSTIEQKLKSIRQIKKLPDRLYEITTSMESHHYNWCYRPDGWNIKQLIHHLADSHMNAFLRLKWALFEEDCTIKNYDENLWNRSSDVTMASTVSSLQLLEGLHDRWTILLSSLSDADWKKGYFDPEKRSFVTLEVYLEQYAWHSEHHYRHLLLALDHEGKYST